MKLKIFFRILNTCIVLASLASIVYGFQIAGQQEVRGNQFIGFGVIGLFLLAMPLFLIVESRGKKMKDYMLTDENIRKMREKKSDSPENQ